VTIQYLTKGKLLELDSSEVDTDSTYTFIPDLIELMGEVSEDTIISRTVYRGGQLKAILFGFAAGQELSEHTAAKPAVIHFLKGEATVTIGDSSFVARAGSWLHMRPHVPHSIVASEPLAMLLLLV
jgi:quercetin dioxygenase-like cupin family protein